MKNIFLIGIVIVVLVGGVWYIASQKEIISKTAAPTSPESQATTGNITQPEQGATDLPAVTVIAQGLDVPWAIAFLPTVAPSGAMVGKPSDLRMLVTERSGRVVIVDTNGTVAPILAATIHVDTKVGGEGGLLGIALHPKFSDNHYVYLYYTYLSSGDETLNRVVRMTFENNVLSHEEVILDKIPGSLYHDGGRIKFGPDGYLYITAGDAQNPSQAQDTNKLGGKVLRVTDEGKIPPGNPFNNPVYSYGHRNPQGLAWDSSGQLWETEHGRSNPTGFDEVNLIESGKNYGWPTIQGDESKPGMITPKRNSGATTTWAPSGAVFVGNSLFFGGLKGETLYESVTQNGQVTALKEHLQGQYGRLRDVVLGPDSMLYITTSNRDGRGNPGSSDDRIIRINPEKL